jgi:hypothetical protein
MFVTPISLFEITKIYNEIGTIIINEGWKKFKDEDV